MNAHLDTVNRYWASALEVVSSADFRAATQCAVDLLRDTYISHGLVLTAGNGGSASTASHFAADLAKFAVPDRHDFRVICLDDNVSALTAWANDASWSEVYVAQTTSWLRNEQAGVLCLFSVHGGSSDGAVSDNLRRAATAAREVGARVVAFTGFDGGALAELADVHVNVPVSLEPLATPLVESLHVLAHHAICLSIRLSLGEST